MTGWPARLLQILVLLATLLGGGAADAQFGSAEPMVDARLVSDRTSVGAGETFHIALRQEIEPGWHTYWRNPGDSGEPTEIAFDLPEGWTAGEIVWPTPAVYPIGPLANYGYADAVTLPVPVTAPADLPPGETTIAAHARWLVCEEICIPEEGDFQITLSTGETRPDPAGARLIEAAFDAAPEAAGPIEAGLVAADGALALTLRGDPLAGGDASVRNLQFFPHDGGVIEHAAEQRVRLADGGARIDLVPGWRIEGAVDAVRAGVVVFERREGGRWRERAVTVRPEPGAAVAEIASGPAGDAAPGASETATVSFLQAAAFALLGGLILNLMPCVFPVLSMKALNIVNKRGSERAHARELGLVFGAGVLITFVALGALLLALRSFGMPGAWGFQLQAPVVVAGLALLMFLVGLNFLGAFQIGTSLQGVGGAAPTRGRSGAFLTGVLAVFVAAPCLAPFMTVALAFAFSQPPAASLTIFAFLGVGLALPFVVVSFFPALLGFLPRPGAWMERFKQLLAFPMFATAIWLAWVLGVQTGAGGVAWLLLAFLAAGFAIWAGRVGGGAGRAASLVGVALAAGALVVTGRLELVETSGAGGAYEDWSPERVAALREEGRPVFVDFTAAWCVSCQANKLGALADADVREAFARHDFVLLRADFTNRDPEIAAALERHGQAGVPLYLVYPEGGGAAEVLPPLLTERIVLDAIDRAIGPDGEALAAQD
ncbi:thiol:disulfide interchange protein [Marinicauda salina]|uniref:Thiol:disulfide interchange protein n=1 Tax=Marinicauda salina TaxID=2135793 RepID=A0A2U2BUY1_9PROT|nr:protein-disulfide reductase DsbD domain-containing protein [Marinicauda salina]PWE17818.1 thiol:disulfide interchange protein [Marinicauda salina]